MGSWDFFIAHAGADGAAGKRLAELLKAGGASVFVDVVDLRPGDVWPQVLGEAQEGSAVTVILLSGRSDDAFYQRDEIVAAIERSRHQSHRAVPVLLENVPLPYGLKSLQAIEAFDDAGLKGAAVELLRLLPAAANERAGKLFSPLIPAVSRFFAGRDALLASLANSRSGRAVVRTQSIAGLGGVGKTTLAAAVCSHQAGTVDVVWWVRAETETTLFQDLSDLGVELGLPAADDLAVQAQRACRALERETRNWLVVFDNADDEDLVHKFSPRRGNGRIIVTTRRRAFDRIGPVVPVDVFDDATAEAFLRDRVAQQNPAAAREPAAAPVARRLGGLPLALEQAGAYVAYSPLRSFASYLNLLEQSGLDPFVEGRPLDYEATAGTTWQVSIDAATRKCPLASKIMAAFGYFAAAPVPLACFVKLAAGPYLAATPDEVQAAIDELYAYSLITIEADTLGVHRLVRDAARRHADTAAARFVLDSLRRVHPKAVELPDTWPTCAGLLPHLVGIAATATTDDRDAAETISWLLDRAGNALRLAGVAAQAIPLLQQATNLDLDLHGPEHRTTLAGRGNLANAYWSAGRIGDAIALYEANLADQERVLGAEHPTTLAGRGSLANAYWSAGRIADAIALDEANLADRERVLGAEHPDTLTGRSSLATDYWSAGRIAEAIALDEANLADRERVLGAEHPDTLTSRNNLAGDYLSAGRIAEAIALYEANLADRVRVLGADHPDTLISRNNLASAYLSAGRIADAIALYEANLADRVRVLGADHPDTLNSRNNLAYAYLAAGRIDEAIALYEANLADRVRVLGAEHPDTVISRNNLADAYRAAGRTSEADALDGKRDGE